MKINKNHGARASMLCCMIMASILTGCAVPEALIKKVEPTAKSTIDEAKEQVETLAGGAADNAKEKIKESLRPESSKAYDQIITRIRECLDSKDEQGFKQLFAKNSIKDETELENGIERIFELYDGGKSVSTYEDVYGMDSEKNDYGVKVCSTEREFELSCDNGKRFYIRINYCYRCDTDENEVGISEMRFETTQYNAAKWAELIEAEKKSPLFVAEYNDADTVRCDNKEFFVNHSEVKLSAEDVRGLYGISRDEVEQKYGEPNSQRVFFQNEEYKDPCEEYLYYLSDKDDNERPLYVTFYFLEEDGSYENHTIDNEDDVVERFNTGE